MKIHEKMPPGCFASGILAIKLRFSAVKGCFVADDNDIGMNLEHGRRVIRGHFVVKQLAQGGVFLFAADQHYDLAAFEDCRYSHCERFGRNIFDIIEKS